MSPDEFAHVLAVYQSAKEARDAAEERFQKAGRLLMASQCGVHYATTPSERVGYNTRHHCTLRNGHDGEHGKQAAA